MKKASAQPALSRGRRLLRTIGILEAVLAGDELTKSDAEFLNAQKARVTALIARAEAARRGDEPE